ncbi:PH domain-containing protein [Spirillospora sp. NPDC047279]|uniref:PH domain-containing protein n=1 Tax=Spirillospora sp. NPDC047279 TaxID=3155478 RepID=UPI0033E7661D
MSVINVAAYPRTLRCWRFLGALAVVTAFCAFTTVLLVTGQTSGRMNPSDLQRAAGACVFGVLTLLGAACLRARVVVEENGLRIVWAFHQRRLSWDEITEISADAPWIGQGWYLHVRTAESEHTAAVFFTSRRASPESGTRLHEPSGETPYGLYKMHAELVEEWRAA